MFSNNPNDNFFNWNTEVSPKELTPGSRFGFSVANIGDIHNDGLQDFAVGAPMAGNNDKGAVFVFHGCYDFKFGKDHLMKHLFPHKTQSITFRPLSDNSS